MPLVCRLLIWGALGSTLYGQSASRTVSPLRAGDSTVPLRIPDSIAHAPVPAAFSEGRLSALESRVHRRGPLIQVGVQRAVPGTAFANTVASTSLVGRTILTASLHSPGATRLRLHFRDFNVESGEVWLFAPGASTGAGPYTGSGGHGDGAFWAGGVEGDTVIVAYVAPPGRTPARFPFTVDSISHLWQAGTPSASGQASPCNLDVTCYSDYRSAAAAVVQYDFVADDGSGSYICSGAMLATRSRSLKPYLLTAHHCISSNAEAQSMQAFFLYQTSACNGPAPSLSAVPTVLGGQYLAGGAIVDGDYSLVLLNGVPGGVTFLGWNPKFDEGAAAEGIHHPQGSYARISFGTRGTGSDFLIGSEKAPANLYYVVNWNAGLTEPGSSGSPLLNTDGELVGTLTAAPAPPPGQPICVAKPFSVYGRFSNVYAALNSYLEDGPGGVAKQPQVSMAITPDPIYQQVPDADGYEWAFTVHIAETAGISTTLTGFKIDSTDYSSAVPGIFGTTRLLASSALSSVTLRTKDLSVPLTSTVELSGVDTSGQFWQAIAHVQFLGPEVVTPKPAMLSGGLGNAASYTPRVAPGSLLTIIGSNLALATETASSVPLPLQLGGATVTINSIPAPLVAVSPSQITAQVPYEVTPGTAQVSVMVSGQSDTQSVQVVPIAPGVFTVDGVHVANPGTARRGDALSLFLTGQGPVTTIVNTGDAPVASSPAELPEIVQTVKITIGGLPAQILFAGIPSGLVGISQINFVVPPDLALGDQTLLVSIGDQEAKAVILAVNP